MAPALANIFMGFYESKWLNECKLNKPKFYLRYADEILAAFDKEQNSLDFFKFFKYPNIKFTIEKHINHSIAFLDVFISAVNNQNLTLQTYHKSIYIGLLLNLKSFNSFHNDIGNIKFNLIKNAYPPFLIDKVIKRYLDYNISSNQNQLKDISDVDYFKIPYIGNLSHHIKNKLSKLFRKSFVKKILKLSKFLIYLKLKIIFHIKTEFLMI